MPRLFKFAGSTESQLIAGYQWAAELVIDANSTNV
jgi:hypothetical protein